MIDVILCGYIELIFRGGISCLPAALLFLVAIDLILFKLPTIELAALERLKKIHRLIMGKNDVITFSRMFFDHILFILAEKGYIHT